MFVSSLELYLSKFYNSNQLGKSSDNLKLEACCSIDEPCELTTQLFVFKCAINLWLKLQYHYSNWDYFELFRVR